MATRRRKARDNSRIAKHGRGGPMDTRTRRRLANENDQAMTEVLEGPPAAELDDDDRFSMDFSTLRPATQRELDQAEVEMTADPEGNRDDDASE